MILTRLKLYCPLLILILLISFTISIYTLILLTHNDNYCNKYPCNNLTIANHTTYITIQCIYIQNNKTIHYQQNCYDHDNGYNCNFIYPYTNNLNSIIIEVCNYFIFNLLILAFIFLFLCFIGSIYFLYISIFTNNIQTN